RFIPIAVAIAKPSPVRRANLPPGVISPLPRRERTYIARSALRAHPVAGALALEGMAAAQARPHLGLLRADIVDDGAGRARHDELSSERAAACSHSLAGPHVEDYAALADPVVELGARDAQGKHLCLRHA